MRFEKLNENKIRIILNTKDLESNNVDFHYFMANPLESQKLFLDMLNKAEKEIGFITKNYNLKIEALQISTGDFILTITRSMPSKEKRLPQHKYTRLKTKPKLKNKAKCDVLNNKTLIYSFNSFDDFCCFANSISSNLEEFKTIAKNISLYEYKNKYFLVLANVCSSNKHNNFVFSSITEFATYISNSDLFKSFLIENGKLIMKNNALKTAVEYFS